MSVNLSAAENVRPQPQDPLYPILREVHIPLDEADIPEQRIEVQVTREVLSSDLSALREAVERARKIISEGKIESLDIDWLNDQDKRHTQQQIGREKDGEIRKSPRMGNPRNILEAQAYVDNSFDITAKIRNGQMVHVYSELLAIIGANWDDQQVLNRSQLINVHIVDKPWQEALTMILGQGGLAWYEEKTKERSKIVVYPVRSHPRIKEDLHALALHAWDTAARNRKNGVAAHALYQRAQQFFEAEEYSSAIRTFFDVSDTFKDMADTDPQVRHWVKEAQLGIGDTMMALLQYREARAVYLNYIGLSLDGDKISSDVYIKAAEASQLYGKRSRLNGGQQADDIIALEKAEDILNNMLLKYRDDTDAANNTVRAHYMLGVLLKDKREFVAAKKYFQAFRESEGSNHRLDSYLAECEFEIAGNLSARGNFKMADQYYGSALALYKHIANDYRNDRPDPLIEERIDHVYRDAFFRVGECHLNFQRPAFPEALVAFLAANEQFPGSEVEGEVLVKIAHCFSRLHADKHAIKNIQNMLSTNGLNDTKVAARIDDLLTDIQSGLGAYGGQTKAKALFYIAQGKYHIAERNRFDIAKIEEVIRYYRRVLTNEPSQELRDASRIGIARAALLAKDFGQAEAELEGIIRDIRVSQRDRSYAGQLLGRHYREQGQLRAAIEAFRGSSTE